MTEVSWSVAIEATGDRALSREEIVELADAVARYDGVASGIGSTTYGVQIVVQAATRDDAAERAREVFAEAVGRSGLPPWPISRIATPLSEADELEELVQVDEQPGRA
ncbi:hypothetical protein [Nocardioides humi]|nr:hypothetical protein [Nocardioides humi]